MTFAVVALGLFTTPRVAGGTPVKLSLAHPISLPASDNVDVTGLHLTAFYGRSRNIYGIEFGFLGVNRTLGDAFGLQLSSIANITDGNVGGIQVAAWNQVDGDLYGLQVGGVNRSGRRGVAIQLAFANVADESIGGVQLSFFNWVNQDFAGVQIGFLNLNNFWPPDAPEGERTGDQKPNEPLRRTWGIQIGGLSTAQSLSGVQFGLANVVGILQLRGNTDLYGTQFGALNLAEDAYGSQAGALNTARNVYGVQIGAVNVANEVHGIQIGAVNYARRLYGIQIGAVNVAVENDFPFFVGVLLGW